MTRNLMTRRSALKGSLLAGGLLAFAPTLSSCARRDPNRTVIGVAMPFQGVSWQAGFLAAAEWAAAEHRKTGRDVVLNVQDAAGDPQTQIQQVNNFILQGVDFIILEPLSNTALNGAVDNAALAGIPVLSTALGSISNTKGIDLQFDYDALGELYVRYIAGRTGGRGTALEIRGLAGVASEQAMHEACLKALRRYPDIRIVAEVFGDWNQSTAQQRVSTILPTLPQVDIIFSQGVAASGAAQAFIAAGRPVPLQAWGFDGVDINMLLRLNRTTGYESVAINVDPGIGGIAVHVAMAKLSGLDVPMTMTAPIPTIPLDRIKADYGAMADSDVIWIKYDYDTVLREVVGAGR